MGEGVCYPLSRLCGGHTGGGGGSELLRPLPLVHRWRTKQNLDYCFLMMYAQSKGIYYVQVSTDTWLRPPPPAQAWVVSPALPVPILSPGPFSLPTAVQLEDDIIAKPNYLSTMKNFALQQPSEDWMILEFSQLGFIGVPAPSLPTWPLSAHFCLCHQLSAPCPVPKPRSGSEPFPRVPAVAPPGLFLPAPLHQDVWAPQPIHPLLTHTCLQPARGFAVEPSPESPTAIKRK